MPNGRSPEPYGTEFTTLHQFSNVKFVKPTSGSTTAPIYTQTQGRVYATIDRSSEVRYVTYYDSNLNRYKQVDIKGRPHMVNGKMTLPHTHYGYLHKEKGTFNPTKREQRLVDGILREWYNFSHGK